MKFVAHTDIVALKAFFLGLMASTGSRCRPTRCCSCTSRWLRLLMIVFPLWKLLHAPGVFFSPTLNQVDDAREQRHARALGRRRGDPKRGAHGQAADRDGTTAAARPGGIPALARGAMAHSKPFVAKPEMQKALGFPGELVADWEKGVAQAGRAARQVARAHGLPGRLRQVRRLHRQVPLLSRHRRPEEHAGGAPGPAALGLSALLHLRRQTLPSWWARAT